MRLFVAIELCDEARSALERLQTKLNDACAGVRWIPPRQLHLTVKFLGEVPDGDVNRVVEAVACAAGRVKAFTLELADCGCFPPRGAVRIVWAGVDEPSGTLAACAEAVEEELERIGFARERRPFSPHLTIGRVREDRSGGAIRRAAEAMTLSTVGQTVETITLMQSVLSPKGPTYTPISKAELGSA